MYDVAVPAYRQVLEAMLGVLDKGEKYCAEKGIAPADMFGTRLFEDMQPLAFQVAQTVNHSIGALGLIRGVPAERAAGPTDFASAKATVQKALDALNALKPADLEGKENASVELKFPGREMKFTGLGYLQSFAMPQFYFHATTGYDILRHKGVPVGKRDFLGKTQQLAA
jgi:hypothetical protein